ncbi:MAG: thioredoxin family protein [Opitutales bacterium]
MKLPNVSILAVVGACVFASAADISPGMTEAEVIAALGEPQSEMSLGAKKVLMFEGYKVELREGKVRSYEVRTDVSAQAANASGSSASAGQASPAVAPGANGTWIEDFDKAKQLAEQTGRPILINFSGSDWCGWCIRLDGEVFETEQFEEFAAKNFVLFKADFPRRSPQRESIANQNKKLAENYGIRGFPTVLIVDENGEVIGRTGYQRGGPEPYIDNLKSYL